MHRKKFTSFLITASLCMTLLSVSVPADSGSDLQMNPEENRTVSSETANGPSTKGITADSDEPMNAAENVHYVQ